MEMHAHIISGGNERSAGEKDLPGPTDDFWYNAAMNSGSTAGQRVTPQTAERVAAVYACKTAITESVSMLPAVVLNEENERKKNKEKDHPLYQCLRHSPNPAMDSFSFFEAMQDNLIDYGNAYAYVARNRAGRVEGLVPLDPNRMRFQVKYDARDMPQLEYFYRESAVEKPYAATQIFHLKYRTKDGLNGRAPTRVAAESFGFNLALLEHGNNVFKNGAFLSGFLKTQHAFKGDEERANFMKSFYAYMGAMNSGKFALLEQGVEYQPHTMNSRDAQFLELSEFSVVQIARLYRIPPVFIQAMDKGMSFASVEQLAIVFIQYTIQPWITRWERAIKHQLLNGAGDEDIYVRFNVNALIRGDLQSRTNSVVQQLQYGLQTINEARFMLDSPAIDHAVGDEPLISHNLIPASKVLEETPEPEPEIPPTIDEPEAAGPKALPEPDPEPEATSGADEGTERFRPLFEDLIARCARKEQKAIKYAAKKEGFPTWAEDFLGKERDHVRDTMRPAVLAWGAPEGAADDFADAYIYGLKMDIANDGRNAWGEAAEVRAQAWADELITNLRERENAEQ